MKKIIILSIVLIGLASCKKDYVCTCVTEDSAGSFDKITGSYTINATKTGATDKCNSDNNINGTITTVCTLN